MKLKRSKEFLPKVLTYPKDAREIFKHLLRKAQLWPEYKMSPRHGDVKKAVLFSEGFDDKVVDILELIPNVKDLCRTIGELRVVCTNITPRGIDRLKRLLPDSEVNVIPCEEWLKKPETGNPDFNLKTEKLELTPDSPATPQSDLSEISRKFSEPFASGNVDKS